MADVVIKDMEMPNKRVAELMRIELACVSRECDRRCENCDLVQDRDELIMVFNEVIRVLETVTNAILLPKGHGRLGDLDALYEIAKTRSMGIYGPWNDQCIITGNNILKAPTIIPAEGNKYEH